MSFENLTIGLIGGGNMARALVRGLWPCTLASGSTPTTGKWRAQRTSWFSP
jgi:hypothetical protein